MQHISLTPFGRQPVSADHLSALRLADAPATRAEADKYTVLRDLTAARANFGVTDRDLAVLAALVSFLPAKQLKDGAQLVVHPSNLALSARAHGMAESTLRRHLAALVRAGLIVRRDSPNGKRYAARGPSNHVTVAYGFDLRPLLVQAPRIAELADIARELALQVRRLREAVVIRLRDAAKIAAWAGDSALADDIAILSRHLRRKLSLDTLTAFYGHAAEMLGRAQALIAPSETPDPGGTDSQNERHQQNTNKESLESVSCQETPSTPRPPQIPLHMILKAAPEIADYSRGGIKTWHDLVSAAETVRPCLGITPDTWVEAQERMGPQVAAVAVASILQRAVHIRSPGAYLRSLSARAAAGVFNPGPMVMALLRSDRPRPA